MTHSAENATKLLIAMTRATAKVVVILCSFAPNAMLVAAFAASCIFRLAGAPTLEFFANAYIVLGIGTKIGGVCAIAWPQDARDRWAADLVAKAKAFDEKAAARNANPFSSKKPN